MFRSVALYTLASAPLTVAMQKSASCVEPESSLVIADILPFAAPFDHVPQIIFANPPYQQRNWTAANFAAIKTAAERATKDGVFKMVLKKDLPTAEQLKPENIQQTVEKTDAQRLVMGETYDWIHAMNLVERVLPRGTITVDLMNELNARLGRLTIEERGFRQGGMGYAMKELDPTEEIFFWYVNRKPEAIAFFKSLENPEEPDREFCPTVAGVLDNNDRFLRVKDGNLISTESIEKFLRAMNHRKILHHKTLIPSTMDLTAFTLWEAEDRQTNPDHQEGWIDIHRWHDSRMHSFCHHREIPQLLRGIVDAYTTSSLHPIEKAARLWLDCVRIHAWNGAHKRTGRALATIILLQHGYLPPLLTVNDVALYDETLMKSLNPESGYELFTQFVARMVKRTQDTYAGQTL